MSMALNTGKIQIGDGRETQITLLATGDLCPAGVAEKKLLEGKAEELFGSMLPELLDKDLSVTNLETALTRNGTPIEKCGPNIKVSPDVMPGLRKAGFDVYLLANNHTRDFGDEAFLETMDHVVKSGGQYAGGGRNLKEAAKPLRVMVKGLKISVIAASMHNSCDAGADSPGSNPLNPAGIAALISKEKKDNDFVLVTIHDGKEALPFPSRRIRENYRAFIDAGAGAVIGHHPHIAQGLEIYGGGLIAYSLGNFLFPALDTGASDSWWRSFSLRLHIGRDGVVSADIIPHKLSKNGVMSVMRGRERAEYMAKIEKLSRIAADDALCDKYYDAAALRVTYYEGKVRELLDLRAAGKTDSEEHHNAAFYCHHMLTTEEHTDVLQSVTKSWASRQTPHIPDDLDELLK